MIKLNKPRAFRRRQAALIKKSIRRDLNAFFSRWDGYPYDRSWDNDVSRAKQLRLYMRNDGKGRTYHCGCDWCVSNKTINAQRNNERMKQEYAACFQNGVYVGDEAGINTFRHQTSLHRNSLKRGLGMMHGHH